MRGFETEATAPVSRTNRGGSTVERLFAIGASVTPAPSVLSIANNGSQNTGNFDRVETTSGVTTFGAAVGANGFSSVCTLASGNQDADGAQWDVGAIES